MIYRAGAAFGAALAIVLAAFIFRPVHTPVDRPSRNGALLPEVELEEPEPAAILLEAAGHGQPVPIADAAEPVPAPLLEGPVDGPAIVLPAHALIVRRRLAPNQRATGEISTESDTPTAPVLYADGAADKSLRTPDFPKTYISHIEVDLTSPHHNVRLAWTGPLAAQQETGPFYSSPGAGNGSNNCNDPEECNRENSNCTPKGEFCVEAFSDYMKSHPDARFVTWFLPSRGIALHSYPNVPDYPASHGCVRLNEHAAQLIHNNSLMGKTKVTVGGTWSR
jgi:hypothetical protein